MRFSAVLTAAAALVIQPVAAEARTIVLSNDDGLTSNVVALYKALKADGHDVIVSVPCHNQSGMGAALNIARPLAPLKEACLNGAAKPGDPGAGAMTRTDGLAEGDFFYVDGTPVMALLYGIDVVGAERWGAEPDLVLSGPNEGQNVGSIVLSSGTVSNAQYAAVRGLPAIALSAGSNSTGDEALANRKSADVAELSAQLVRQLDEQAGEGAVLPSGLALNVNFPDELDGAEWRVSRIGTYNAYQLRFVDNMAEAASPAMRAMARQHGMEVPPLPGLSFEFNQAEPTAHQVNDESIVYRTDIAVSPMQPGYEADLQAADWLADKLPGNEAE